MGTPEPSFLMQRNYFIFSTGWTFLCLLTSTTVTTGFEVRQGKSESVTIKITNACLETIWPAFGTQSGKGPSTGGFELKSKTSKEVVVFNDWEGRVCGRTNCSFNPDGTSTSNGAGKACETANCSGILSCAVTGNTPATLFEIALAGGEDRNQSFYDISLADGYNLPMGATYIPNPTNCACIATAGHTTAGAPNASFPTLYNTKTTDAALAHWCPWDLQLNTPARPIDGVSPHPNDTIARPAFSPFVSGCAKIRAATAFGTRPSNSPATCRPSLYARAAKAVCPDAYSYAFDDAAATFSVPSSGGGGWDVAVCHAGASTSILSIFGDGLKALSQSPVLATNVVALERNTSLIQQGAAASRLGLDGRADRESMGALVVVLAWACLS